jgi:hypothetical protein
MLLKAGIPPVIAILTERTIAMTDNLHIRRPQDPTKINVHEAWEVKYWAQSLGVTEQQLKEAVKAVGVSTSAVKRYLGK